MSDLPDRLRGFHILIIDEAADEIERLRAALTHISSPSQTLNLLWWQAAAREALEPSDAETEQYLRDNPTL